MTWHNMTKHNHNKKHIHKHKHTNILTSQTSHKSCMSKPEVFAAQQSQRPLPTETTPASQPACVFLRKKYGFRPVRNPKRTSDYVIVSEDLLGKARAQSHSHFSCVSHTRTAQVHEKGVCRMIVFVLYLTFSLLTSHPSFAVSVRRLSLSLDFPVHTFLPYLPVLKAMT